jgi:glycosyltransferase involved in cell wall biosynthesis
MFISFIIIGRNEGKKLTACINSVIDTIESNSLNNYEIIYVDSNSTDDSIERAKHFNNVAIYQLTGTYNAAIGRNLGARKATGDVLFFIDGDMEIIAQFLPNVYNEKNGLLNDFSSGHFINYFYNQNGELQFAEEYKNAEKDLVETVTGGLFLIKKNIWNLVGGMDNQFVRGEDPDLGLKLAKKNIFLYRKKEIAAKHHTIAYLDKNRMWKELLKKTHLYGRSLLYRKHFFNKHMYPILIRQDYSMLVLFIIIILIVLAPKCWYFSILYFLLLIFRSKFKFQRVLYFFLRDLSCLIGFFLFFPSKNKKIQFIKIVYV